MLFISLSTFSHPILSICGISILKALKRSHINAFKKSHIIQHYIEYPKIYHIWLFHWIYKDWHFNICLVLLTINGGVVYNYRILLIRHMSVSTSANTVLQDFHSKLAFSIFNYFSENFYIEFYYLTLINWIIFKCPI